MTKKIVAYKPLPSDVEAYLREHADVAHVDPKDHAAFVAALQNADGAIGASVKISSDMIEGAKQGGKNRIYLVGDDVDPTVE